MVSSQQSTDTMRKGIPLLIGREPVSLGRNILVRSEKGFEYQYRLFVNDPWELITEAVVRAMQRRRVKDIALSFVRQAQDYFRAAAVVRELAVSPVLYYYAFLNLSKAYALSKGNATLAGRAHHGMFANPKPRTVVGSTIKFDKRRGSRVLHELIRFLDGNANLVDTELPLGHLMPQILPGHRLWCYATGRRERFLTVIRSDILHTAATQHVWLAFHIDRTELDRLGISDAQALSRSDFAGDFVTVEGFSPKNWVCFEQKTPESYVSDPGEALARIVATVRNRVWETVRVISPYRKPYIYICPRQENKARLPQLLSVYLMMFFLSSVTRYTPGYYEYLIDSKFGPFIQTFVSESPMQFLYLLASEILGREVSKPAIV